MNYYQPTELGAVYSALTKSQQQAVDSAVDSFRDARIEAQQAAIQRIKKNADPKATSFALNEYLSKGDFSPETDAAIADQFAMRIINEGDLEAGLAKASVDLTGSASGNNPAGLMNQAYGNQFFMNAKKESNFFSEVDTFQLRARTQKVDRFTRGNRFLYPAGYSRVTDDTVSLGRALKAANFYGYTVSKTEFAATPLQGVLRIPREDLLNNITGNNLMPFLLSQAQTRQIVDDMSDQIINGDTALAGTDADNMILRQKDGLLKLGGTGLAAGGRFNYTVALNAQQLVEPEHWRRMGNAKFYLPHKARIGYLKELGALATDLGDFTKLNGGQFAATGIPVVSEDYLPMPSTNNGVGMLVDPKIVKLGIWDALRIEADYEPSSRDYLFYVYVEYDFKVLEPEQIVKITGLAV